MPGIREWIFQNGTGNVTALYGDFPDYGSYQVLGNLTIDLGELGAVSNYRRSLDLESGVYLDQFKTGNVDITRYARTLLPKSLREG